jgi:hypothetical protein
MTTTWCPEIGTEGDVTPGVRQGLPDHLDGVPVGASVPVFMLPRRYNRMPYPLPMFELREDGDGSEVAARWPEPFSCHELPRRSA